jgi:hypothetical protein
MKKEEPSPSKKSLRTSSITPKTSPQKQHSTTANNFRRNPKKEGRATSIMSGSVDTNLSTEADDDSVIISEPPSLDPEVRTNSVESGTYSDDEDRPVLVPMISYDEGSKKINKQRFISKQKRGLRV